jgi:hypothetical protein
LLQQSLRSAVAASTFLEVEKKNQSNNKTSHLKGLDKGHEVPDSEHVEPHEGLDIIHRVEHGIQPEQKRV